MNKALLKYEMKDKFFIFVALLIYGAVLGGMFWILDKELIISKLDAAVMALFVFGNSDMMQISSINGHRCFGYSRRIQFRNSFFAGSAVAAFMAFIQTVVLIFTYDEYIQFFIEDTEKNTEIYHMPFIPEAFIVNLLLLEFVMLLKLIAKTTVIYSTKNAYTIVMQERAARLGKKCTAVKIGCFILSLVALGFFVILYMWMYNILCQDEIFLQVALIMGLLIADIILYFVAKKRYSPKYI